MAYNSNCATLEHENRFLRQTAEDQRRVEEQRQEDEKRKYERQRRECQQECEDWLREVEDWPDAFGKGLILYRREAREEVADNARMADNPEWTPFTNFRDAVVILERAQAVYREAVVEAEQEFARLKRQAVLQVANTLEAEFGEAAEDHVQALHEGDMEYWVRL